VVEWSFVPALACAWVKPLIPCGQLFIFPNDLIVRSYSSIEEF
jgi:hypothetical protein